MAPASPCSLLAQKLLAISGRWSRLAARMCLKAAQANYLKQAGDALTVTTSRDEALRLFPVAVHTTTNTVLLTLAADASKAVGVKDGQLAIVEANSFYSVVRILDSTNEVKGAVAPKFSDISNVYYYKLQFKANPRAMPV